MSGSRCDRSPQPRTTRCTAASGKHCAAIQLGFPFCTRMVHGQHGLGRLTARSRIKLCGHSRGWQVPTPRRPAHCFVECGETKHGSIVCAASYVWLVSTQAEPYLICYSREFKTDSSTTTRAEICGMSFESSPTTNRNGQSKCSMPSLFVRSQGMLAIPLRVRV